MPDAIVLANRAAGRGFKRRRLEQVERMCAAAGVELLRTATPDETRQRAAEAAARGVRRVIAAGGDGTAHYVLNGLAGTEAALGVIPVGSGNDIARALGVPRNVQAATRLAFQAPIRRVDLGRVCGSVFLSVASVGMAALANRIANRVRLHNTVIYVYALLRALVQYRVASVRVETDDLEFQGPFMLAAVGNGPSVGGGMRVAPGALLDDARLDVIVAKRMSRLRLLRCFPTVFLGTHLRFPEVLFARGTRVLIDADRPLDIFADGELVGQTPAEFEVLPAAVNVVSPG